MLIGHYLERPLACLYHPGRELNIKQLIHALSQAVELALRRLGGISHYGKHEFKAATEARGGNFWEC